MDDKDRKNLQFILTLKTSQDWSNFRKSLVEQFGVEEALNEFKYALSLIELEKLESLDDVQDLSEARALLDQILK
jgi:hypothetical protein